MLKRSRITVSLRECRFGMHTSAVLLAGHSKWANIRHDKAKNDARRSKEAYQMASRISLSVRQSGVDGNAQLATLVEKAKKMSVTKKIIENAIKRGKGESTGDSVQTFDVSYEFMGPGAVAIIVEATTDNKTRTVNLVKHALSKFNASASGCLYLFKRKGWIIFEPKDPKNETLDDILEVAIDIGAEDVENFNDTENEYPGETLYKVITEPSEVASISNKLSEQGYKLKDVATGFIADPESAVDFPEDHAKSFEKAMNLLDEVQEVTNYYTNIRE